jgi:type I restriction enzyme M protein
VECKQKKKEQGEAQLKLYMDMSSAMIGVWYNGDEHLYLRKVHHPDGSRTYEPLPDIPRFGQRLEDIGRFRRGELTPTSDLRSIFRDIRNHLAGHVTGITRDEALAQEIINVLFCKIYDEVKTPADQIVTFRAGLREPAEDVKARILGIFDRMKTDRVDGFPDVFSGHDAITLPADAIVYIVGELQNYALLKSPRDAIGDAFETFIGPALRGQEGQFFTPRNVVRLIVEGLDPNPGELLIDPACGSGGFLIVALEHVWTTRDAQAATEGWDATLLATRKRRTAEQFFRGIEKDAFLAKVTKAYMAIVGDGRAGIYCENSLQLPAEWLPADMAAAVPISGFDVVMTNPPFGSKIRITGPRLLAQYPLARRWAQVAGQWRESATLLEEQTPQLLFIDRCMQLLRPGGRMGIVLPESVFGMPKYDYVVEYLRTTARIVGVISMPEALFKTSGKGGTHTKTAVLFVRKLREGEAADADYPIFMADAKWCGHDSRGNPTLRVNPDGTELLMDDVPIIAERFRQLADWG